MGLARLPQRQRLSQLKALDHDSVHAVGSVSNGSVGSDPLGGLEEVRPSETMNKRNHCKNLIFLLTCIVGLKMTSLLRLVSGR